MVELISPEVRAQVRKIQIQARKLVSQNLLGQYRSTFKGQGMTFADFREYVPGDDVRAISWNLTAKTNRTFIKKFEEEREISVVLLMDVSGSMGLNRQGLSRRERLAQAAALLGLLVLRNQDQLGLCLFSDRLELYLPPKKGRAQFFKCIQWAYAYPPQGQGTDLAAACSWLSKSLKKRSVIFWLSDFSGNDFTSALKHLALKHEVIAVQYQEPTLAQEALDGLGLLEVLDPETGEPFLLDLSPREALASLKLEQANEQERLKKEFAKAGVGRIVLAHEGSLVAPFQKFFKKGR
jgi:uncharacterized protein (DUF58 family)